MSDEPSQSPEEKPGPTETPPADAAADRADAHPQGGSTSPGTSSSVNPAAFLATWRRDVFLALGFFTRLPVPAVEGHLGGAVRAFPFAGLIVGLIGALVYFVAMEIGLSGLLAALLAVAATGIVTGALHEDGWADVCDALGARGGVEKRLEILRDSRLGSYGGLALIFSTSIKVAAIANLGAPELVAGALVAAHSLSRGVLPLVMARMPLARSNGLAHDAGRPSITAANWSLIIALIIAVIAVAPVAALVALVAALAATWLVAKLAQAKFGGYTGDVLGAVEQLAEMAILVNLITLT
ncbi:adenosylcobinamide-GDP ribazoletransferase [Dongia sp.]|uniref:adenosylcobinamide-GDP ribazoletransferase n=1 Tax=Dongia sp. TaxID=1977262 RepID=UPI0035B38861